MTKQYYYQTKIKINLFLLSFENVNIYAKGNYRIKIQCFVNSDKCEMRGLTGLERWSEMGKRDSQLHLTKEFKMKFQSNFQIDLDERVEVNDLIAIETPVFNYTKDSKIVLKLTLLKS